MTSGIGIDSVEIKRCAHWHTYSPERLKRLFCPEEIEYCLSIPAKSAERFAARFAAKEAFYKALSIKGAQQPPFFTIARQVQVVYRQGKPILQADWGCLNCAHPECFCVSKNVSKDKAHLSLTHTATIATAIVILEKLD